MPCNLEPVREQGPGSNLDYGFRWTPWLGANETITGSVWAADPAPLVSPLVLSNPTNVGGVTMVWITGGVVGQDYLVTNTITTTDGALHRVDSRSFVLQVRDVMA